MASLTVYPSALCTDFRGRLILAARVEIVPGFCIASGDRFLAFCQTGMESVRDKYRSTLKDEPLSLYLNTEVLDAPTEDYPLVNLDGLMRDPADRQARISHESLGDFMHRVMHEVSEHATGPETPLIIRCAWGTDIKTSVLTLNDGSSVTLTAHIDKDLQVCLPEDSVARVTLRLHNLYD